jgi:transposase-like protein
MENIAAPIALSKGRRFRHEQRQEILARFEQSGLSQREFVVREGMGLSTLSKWVRQGRSVVTKSASLQFKEVVLPSTRSSWAMEVVNPQNWVVRFGTTPSTVTLQQLLAALPC